MAKAAVQLAVSQPAVSKAIADMEHTLGAGLFDRLAQGVEPTPYGRALIKWAGAVFDDVRQGVEEIGFRADPGAGELRICVAEPMLEGFLSAVLAKINPRYPRIGFEVTQRSSFAQMLRELRERRFDLIVGRVARGQEEDDLATEVLFEEPWAVVAGPQNPLTRRRKLALNDLLDEPWTLPPPDTVVGIYLSGAFRAAGIGPAAHSRHLRLDLGASCADGERSVPGEVRVPCCGSALAVSP